MQSLTGIIGLIRRRQRNDSAPSLIYAVIPEATDDDNAVNDYNGMQVIFPQAFERLTNCPGIDFVPPTVTGQVLARR